MPSWGVYCDETEFEAAQALVDLHSNCLEKNIDNVNRNETTKARKLCNCEVASNVPSEQPVAVVEHNITGTAGAVVPRTAPKKRLLHRYTSNTIDTRDVETQSEDDYSEIKALQLAVTQRDETIAQLRQQLEAYKRVKEPVGKDHDTPDDEEDSREMTIDDNDTPDSKLNTDGMVRIGNKSISSKILKSIKWSSYTTATRQLLSAVFSRRTLATHSLTGKPSPAFPEKVPKKKLDQLMVKDIVHLVAQRCHVAENLVRLIITTKCADEAKRVRTKETKTKKRKSSRILRENIRPGSDSDEH